MEIRREEVKRIVKNSFLFYSLFILLTINAVSAGTHCTETTYNHSRIITNDYDEAVHYSVEFEGSARIFTKSTPSMSELRTGFPLAPGESKKVSFVTELPFEGEYSLSLIIEDHHARSETYSFNFNVTNCHTINVEFNKQEDYCYKKTGNYSVTVENTGEYDERLNLLVNDYSKTFNLSKGGIRRFNYSFTPESFNNALFDVRVYNEKIEYDETHELNVANCEGFDYEMDEASFCQGMKKSHEFVLTNTGINNDTYELNTSSEDLILNKSEVFIKAGESEKVSFDIISDCTEEGSKLENIRVKSGLTSEEKIIPVVYTLEDCFGHKVSVNEDFTDYCEEDDKIIQVKVENTGSIRNHYTSVLKLGSVNKTKQFSLEPDEEEEIVLNYSNIPQRTLHLFFQSIDSSICSSIETFERSIQVKDYDTCYSGSLFLQPRFYNNDTELRIVNNGTRVNDYNVSLLAYNEVDNATVSLESGEERTYHLTDLVKIHNEYGVNSFKVIVDGKGVNLSSNTTYYPSNIQGMLVSIGENVSFYLGLVVLLIFIYAFIRKE